jgi:AAA+ superfamily predicted ATPase
MAAEPFLTNSDHLAAELAWLNRLLHRAVIDWRDKASASTDIFKGLYISDAEIDGLLKGGASPAGAKPGLDEAIALREEIDAHAGASRDERIPLALPQLVRLFALNPFEAATVLLALAPEIDLSYERFFAYLQDDLSRKRPTVDLALRLLCPLRETHFAALQSFSPQAPLFRLAILKAPDRTDAPLPARPLALDPITLGFLLGSGAGVVAEPMRPHLRALRTPRPLDSLQWPEPLRQSLFQLVNRYSTEPVQSPQRLICHLWGPDGCGRRTLAAAVCRDAGVPLIEADVQGIVENSPNLDEALRDVFRQAIFLQSAVYLANFDVLGDDPRFMPALRKLSHAMDEFSWLTFIGSTKPWMHAGLFAGHSFVSIELPRPGIGVRAKLWSELAEEAAFTGAFSWEDMAARFRLSPGAIQAALQNARSAAALRGHDAPVSPGDLVAACHRQSNRRLGLLAQPLRVRRGWADLTLPPNAKAQLHEICAHVRHRRRVFEDWGFARPMASSKGLCALFYGASGAGKTMAVEIVARELELEVYKIDLSTVVSKYIGETEKNLSRIFEEAESSNAILFFDEADALFGKRSEVKDAHDRFANIEINYLLQRIEEFEGLVILASNLRKNIDEGFFRRMHFAVEFPVPDAEHRYRIWNQHFPEGAPVAKDVDIAFLAGRFPLAGGNIRNIVLNAAFLAASNGGEIRMEHLIRATRREYDKTGRVCTETDFSPYQGLLAEVREHHA